MTERKKSKKEKTSQTGEVDCAGVVDKNINAAELGHSCTHSLSNTL